jgi:hypothetical protein
VTYGDDEIDAAIERLAADVAARSAQPEFPTDAMTECLQALRRMEAARRSGDHAAAVVAAGDAAAGFDKYRPTNATSRAKALLGEVIVAVLAHSALSG